MYGRRFDLEFGAHNFRALETDLPGTFSYDAAIAAKLFLLWMGGSGPALQAEIECAVRSGLRA